MPIKTKTKNVEIVVKTAVSSGCGRMPTGLEFTVSAKLLTFGRKFAVAANGRCKQYN